MKRTLFLSVFFAAFTHYASAFTYNAEDLKEAVRDTENNVYYDGNGYFAVTSAANTEVILTINLESLTSYVNSNDYTGSSYLLLWENSIANYGICDYSDIKVPSPDRTPALAGYTNKAFEVDANKPETYISYGELEGCAIDGNVTLTITNHKTDGVIVKAVDNNGETVTLYNKSNLKYGSMTGVTGYHINLNYVSSVTFNTPSTLDASSYFLKEDYSETYTSSRTGTTSYGKDSIGRVMFLGDSITHGVDDQSYRWQFFKILTDNGIENEIVGPRDGYNSMQKDGIGQTRDMGSSYGGENFANVHLAQASGRTHNIISGSNTNMSGVNYGGHSTASAAESYDCNTWICMMGTNDLLSDKGTTTADYCTKMQKMLGGTVTYDSATKTYNWVAGENWGNMATIVSDVCQSGDKFYMLSILPWATHGNNQNEENRLAGAEFNRNLEIWTKAFAKETQQNVEYVDVTKGMIDITSKDTFRGHDAFFNRPGTSPYPTHDGLHPNEQGSLIMAGNLAKAMEIGGRTAGLYRAASGTQGTTWNTGTVGALSSGESVSLAENAFTKANGYTIDFSAIFGNGDDDGIWLGSENALSISLGHGNQGGTLNLSEGYIMWGSDVLFCWDNSTLADEGNLRIAWHNGNAEDNVLSGYYVWLGDMLIGQALAASTVTDMNGITFSANGADALVENVTWSNTAFAPTTSFATNDTYAYHVTQAVDFTNAKSVSYANSGIISMNHTDTDTFKHTGTIATFLGLTRSTTKANFSLQESGTVETLFGTMEHGGLKGNAGILTIEVASGATIKGGTYDGSNIGIAGAFKSASADEFHVIVTDGQINAQHSIIGGAIAGAGKIGTVTIDINGGNLAGSVYGGSFGANANSASVGEASITVRGGTIGGNIVAGGTHGTIGSASVIISGGVIKGNITEGVETKSSVVIKGNTAEIGHMDGNEYRYGTITADHVVLQKIVASTKTEHGMDQYAGAISTEKLTLDHINVAIHAQVDTDRLKMLEVTNSSLTSLVMGDSVTLDSLKLESNTIFSAYREEGVRTNTSEHETTITVGTLTALKGATLNANLVFNNNSVLILNDSLTMGSDVALSSGMSLTLSDAMLNELYGMNEVALFTGVDKLTLDGQKLADGIRISANSIFSNLDPAWDFNLSFSDGTVSIYAVPEPATATLSLLALAGLAMRRRRRV